MPAAHLTRYVTRDGRIVCLARNLIDLVDIDDAALRTLNVIVGSLQQFQDNVLNVLTDIARLGKSRCVSHRKGNIEHPRQCLRQQCLATTSRPNEEDIRLRNFNVTSLASVGKALVVIVHSHSQHPLCLGLTNHIFIENLVDICGCRHAIMPFGQGRFVLFTDNIHAQFNAFITDEHCWASDKLAHFMLALSAE